MAKMMRFVKINMDHFNSELECNSDSCLIELNVLTFLSCPSASECQKLFNLNEKKCLG